MSLLCVHHFQFLSPSSSSSPTLCHISLTLPLISLMVYGSSVNVPPSSLVLAHILFPPNFQNNTINNPDSPLPLPYSYPIPLTLSLSLISSCLIPCIGCGCISNLRVSSSPPPPTQPFSCPSHIASVDRFDSFSHSPLTSSSIHFILSLSIFFYVSVPLCFPHLLITTHSQRTFMTVSFFLSFNVLFFFSSVCWFSILHLYWSSDINGIHHDFFSYHLHNRCACVCSQSPELDFFRFGFDVEKPRGDEDMKVPEAPCHTFGSANSSAQTARQVCLFLMIRTVPCLIDYHSSETYPTKLILYGNSLPNPGALRVSFSGARSQF